MQAATGRSSPTAGKVARGVGCIDDDVAGTARTVSPSDHSLRSQEASKSYQFGIGDPGAIVDCARRSVAYKEGHDGRARLASISTVAIAPLR
jgi:hypothetical protein